MAKPAKKPKLPVITLTQRESQEIDWQMLDGQIRGVLFFSDFELPKPVRHLCTRYQITYARWDELRKHMLELERILENKYKEVKDRLEAELQKISEGGGK